MKGMIWTDCPEKMQHFEGTYVKDYEVSKSFTKLVTIKMRFSLLEKPFSNERFVHTMMNVQSL